MPDYKIVEVDSRMQWTTVSKGGGFVVEVRYHGGKWDCGKVLVGPDGRDEEGKHKLAPLSMGFPLSGIPRYCLIGRYIDNDGYPSEPFYVGSSAEIGPFPKCEPGLFRHPAWAQRQ